LTEDSEPQIIWVLFGVESKQRVDTSWS